MPGALNRVIHVLRGERDEATGASTPVAPAEANNAEDMLPLLEALSEGVLFVDAAGRIRGANEAACRLLGANGDDLLGQTLLEATHLPAVSEISAQALAAGTEQEIQARTVGPGERFLRVRAMPRRSSNGSFVILQDQTELQHLRTVRTEFVANVSHELRTPLASIRAAAETLQEAAASDPDAASRFLSTIIREADRLVRLSEDLLDLSRAESGRRERTRFDLGCLVGDVAARLAVQAEKRGVTLTLAPAAAPFFVIADAGEIDQVVFNLLDNAIKYTPSGGQVTITLERLGDAVALSVADTGIGILSHDLPRIFERFWRADRARRFRAPDGAGTGGTGLGLSIVKHIVEAHKGAVWAESELNRGSRFTFTLPLEEVER